MRQVMQPMNDVILTMCMTKEDLSSTCICMCNCEKTLITEEIYEFNSG